MDDVAWCGQEEGVILADGEHIVSEVAKGQKQIHQKIQSRTSNRGKGKI
jgi:hypothetical protein